MPASKHACPVPPSHAASNFASTSAVGGALLSGTSVDELAPALDPDAAAVLPEPDARFDSAFSLPHATMARRNPAPMTEQTPIGVALNLGSSIMSLLHAVMSNDLSW
jgi:hypothetical protein